MLLKTLDGTAILGYAGLGATARGTEPTDWMNSVLRGRKRPLEHVLGDLAEAMQRQFPRHLARLPKDVHAAHNILIPAFVDGEVRMYTIDLVLSSDREAYSFRYTRHVVNPVPSRPYRAPRIGLAGSGAIALVRDKHWIRNLLRLVRACDAKKVPPIMVEDQLASINALAHRRTADGSVGPYCIVAWRHNKGGGGHQFYDGTTRTDDTGSLPTIANGMDVQAIAQTLMPHLMKQMNTLRSGAQGIELDIAKLNSELAKLPEQPDERLK